MAQLLAFIVRLLICLLSSNMNTEARIAANKGNQVKQFRLLSLNSEPVKLPDHEHNGAVTSHQARSTTLLPDGEATPSPRNSMACNEQTTWCIAKPSTDNELLLGNIDFCCRQQGVNCSVIQPGGQCYLPNNNYAHASVVMNLYYKAYNKLPHTCYFQESGLIISQDPSFGDCRYPS